MINVVLFQPEIPPNTGNIVRLCANSGYQLHLIEPLGFDIEEKKVRRAGLDYHEFAAVKRYPNFQAYVDAHPDSRMFACTTKGKDYHHQVSYQPGDSLVFGPETRGLPDDVLALIGQQNWLRIPMQPDSRSMNLSNAVAVFVFESWRQLDFAGSK
ncbi:tRNA (uridine(34)/cytosine(34)/5-carboxymethylaminomethyluridine(34)-2'-O)-methyltransferase TrmL [Psychrosphaera ytuae]|uniref:tRNA (cytidine(34)-2'-O)-methyltransferase n=1 Tax=Psychrosphaera ytuae TaxID=2820710 RepID=A0A975HJM1_9GAMM|nr:tRNA (uridine(34)/cytosine(34)/5-carboxymethylaminomethyluridine(34)-2'-O)-methyltransferase TrmL [Psychrosphaera ytuae]QTH63374.1 tRNA (uridine(34)/cytosine(34)/5-carboxymethylaminomethyluridine(34)-2'-O)-methyltransferase TrmL [Psychrosphaera ytuae]